MAYRALCRILEARTGFRGIAFYERAEGRFVQRHATKKFLALAGRQSKSLDWRPAGSELQQVPPETFGLRAAMCLVQPFGTGEDGATGLVVVASRRQRRSEGRLAEMLRDVADVAAHLPPGGRRFAADVTGAPDAAVIARTTMQPRGAGMPELPRTVVHQSIASLLGARGGGERLAFVVLDIDRFRAVNEALGTEVGDAVLAATALRIGECIMPRDRLVRLERDRFLVVTSPAWRDVRALAKAMLAAAAAPLDLADRRLVLRASVGVVLAGGAETSPARLLMQAEGALRQAKAAGGGRLAVHEPDVHAALLDRSLLELDLRHALESGELSLVYQPYVDLETGETSGVEALMRWRHPTRGEIAPATFIPLAEATGQILPIGIWALRTACAEAAEWAGNFMLSVNISPLQFHALDFVAQVEAVLAGTGFPAERLELEITERVLMRDNPQTIAQLRALIALGVRIALDDFGTGYSALAYLSRLPHHRIKLDRSFVQDMERPSTAALIQAIVRLARASGVAVTAEGVERPDQLRAVKALGFTHAQGFVTGLPLRVPDAGAIARHNMI